MSRTRRVPTYRYHKASKQGVVVIDGRSHYLGPWKSRESREKYNLLIEEWLVNSKKKTLSGKDQHGNSLCVNEIIVAFWNHAGEHYRRGDGTPSEELGNLKVALRPLRQHYGETLAREFGPLALRAIRDEMIESGLARTSVNARINRIRRAFKWAASVEMVPVSVVQALATVAGLQRNRSKARETDPIGPVSSERVEATLPNLARPVAGMVRLQSLTGMRPGEVCMMRGRDLAREGETWTYIPGSHKTEHHGKRRSIAIGPKAVEVVKEFLVADPDAYLFSPAEAVAELHARRTAARKSSRTPSEEAKRVASPGSNHATRYRRNSYRNAINRACDKAFLHPILSMIPTRRLTDDQKAELTDWRKSQRWHPNQLRHAVATAIRAKYGLEAAQVVLGHSKPDTTITYAERDFGRAVEVMREIG